ncbi:MAG: oligosaccharide flippase family protein [Acidobacteria bacterium]|nr:oligosaccharide flippase family protein [Acidobacteriota bacterium]
MIRQNILANVVARAWGVISVYLFVPLYLKFLGIEAYGIVGFYSTLLAVLAFADMGFTAALNRELAVLSARRDSAEQMGDLLRTYELTYLCVTSAVAVMIGALAPVIAAHWLRSSALQPREMAAAIRLMGVAIALQLPAGLFVGGLMGLQRQVRANSLTIVIGVLRGLGAVLVLWLVSRTIFAFALWQLISNVIYCSAARLSLWRALPSRPDNSPPHFRWQVFRNTWRYAGGMAGMAVLTALVTQADKLVVSKMLSLEMLGYYTLAAALATAPLVLAGPIALAVFPRLTALVASGDFGGVARLYHRTSVLVAVASFPAGMTLSAFAGDFIRAWTGSALAAKHAGVASSLLLGGQLLLAGQSVPSYVALAYGCVRLNLQINFAALLLLAALLPLLVAKYGVVGAGCSWVIMAFCTVPPFMYLLHRRFLHGELRQWVLHDMARPLLAALPIILLARLLLPVPSSRLLVLGLLGSVWCVSAAAAVWAMPELRVEFTAIMRTVLRGYSRRSACRRAPRLTEW